MRSPRLTDLDVKGRDIAGLEPRFERFSHLELGRDVKRVVRNERVTSPYDLDRAFVFVNPTGGEVALLVEPPHLRTITHPGIEAMYTGDRVRETYYAANTKGVGYLKPTLKGGLPLDAYDDWKRVDEYGRSGAYGFSDADDFYDPNGGPLWKSEFLTEAGLRTELFYAAGDLCRVYYKGKNVSVWELQRGGILPSTREFSAKIGIRLMKDNTRVAEFKDADDDRARDLMAQAFDVFNRENADKGLGFPELAFGEPASERLFFRTFFERMGRNLAVFQNIGYIGWHMHSANITLAAEIVDTGAYMHASYYDTDDSREEFLRLYAGVRRGILKDIRDVTNTLKLLFKSAKARGLAVGNRETLTSAFSEAFESSLDRDALLREGIDRDALIAAFRKITYAVLAEGRNLASIKRGEADVADWGLL